MVEVNDIGEQVANTLQFDLEYENLVMASMRGKGWTDTWWNFLVAGHN